MPASSLPLRVAFLLHAPSGGGAQRRTLDLAAELARRGVAAELVLISREGPLPLPAGAAVTVLGAPLAGGRRLQCAASVPALADWLRRHPPDVLMAAANHVHLSALAAHGLARSPSALVLRASNHLAGGGRGQPIWDWLKRRSVALYDRADTVVAVSADIAAQVHRLCPAARVAVLPNPVVDDSFPRRMDATVPHAWLRTRARPVVLGVGRLEPQKDFPTLLRAAARIRGRVILLGDGSQRRYLADLARALDLWLDMPGFVADPLPWMAQCSAFCLSSAWEGMPGALIEAMACGTPVVATDCPGGAAEILDGGRLAPLVAVGDDRAMAEALDRVIRHPPDPEALRQRAQCFSVDAAATAFLDLFNRLAAPRRSPVPAG